MIYDFTQNVKLAYLPSIKQSDRHRTTVCGSRNLPTSDIGNDSQPFIKPDTSPTTAGNMRTVCIQIVRTKLPDVVTFQELYISTFCAIGTKRSRPDVKRFGPETNETYFMIKMVQQPLGSVVSSFWGPPVSAMVPQRRAILHNSEHQVCSSPRKEFVSIFQDAVFAAVWCV